MTKIFILLISLYLFLYCFVFKQDYINVSRVIKKQLLSILRSKNDRRKRDLYAFINIYIIPLILSILVSLDNILNVNFYNNIILVLTILVSVFLTLISIITARSYKSKSEKQKKVVNLTYNNVYFLTIISVLLLLLCFLKTSFKNFKIGFIKSIPIMHNIITINNCKVVFNIVVIYLIIEIIIHLLIVLKRIEQIFFITFED